jgi:cyclophilin family peptidyl-prolyl cis-trans isomerase
MRNFALAGVMALAAGAAGATGLKIEVAGEANGVITIDLFEDVAPLHVARITELAASGAYDGVVFHRVIEGFMAQTGDVQFGKLDGDIASAGMGDSGQPDLPAEFSDIAYEKGVVGMGRKRSPDSANSQFFIMFDAAPHLDGEYTVVGRVTQGQDVVDMIKRGAPRSGQIDGTPDVMKTVTVTE